MVAALLRVVYGGIQDARFITQKAQPNIRFFVKAFIRAGRFTTQWVRLDFDTLPTLGNSSTITLPRKGQLLSRLYLVTTMPDIATPQKAAIDWSIENNKEFAGPRFGWTNSLGHALLQQATLEIGGTRVEQIDGRLLEVMDEYYTPLEKVSLVDKLLPRRTSDFTPGGAESLAPASRLASASADNTIRLWNPASGVCESLLKGHTDDVTSISGLGSGGERLVSGSVDKTVRVWDAWKGTSTLVLLGHTDIVWTVCDVGDADGRRVASGSDDTTVRVWDTVSGVCLQILNGHTAPVYSVCAFNDSGAQRLASASVDRTVRVWNPDTGVCLQVLTGHTNQVFGVCAFNISGAQRLASASVDRTVRIWNPISGVLLLTLEGHTDYVSSVCYLGNGLIASGSYDNTVRIWDTGVTPSLQSSAYTVTFEAGDIGIKTIRLTSGQIGISNVDPGSQASLLGVRAGDIIFSVDGFTSGLISRLSKRPITVEFSRIVNPACIHILDGHTGSINSVSALSDGRLASASEDKTVRLWYVATGTPLRVLNDSSAGSLGAHTKLVWSVCSFNNSPNNPQLLPSFGADTVTQATTPLPFWFSCGDAGTFLPLDALQADPVKLRITFAAPNALYTSTAQRDISKLTNIPAGGEAYFPLASSPFYYHDAAGTDISGLDGYPQHFTKVSVIPGITEPTAQLLQNLGDTYLMAEYVYLDRVEANRFRLADIQVPILQHYAFDPVDTRGAPDVNCYMKIANPTRNLFFYAQRFEAGYWNAPFLATRDLSGADTPIAPWWPNASPIGTRVYSELQPGFVYRNSEPISQIQLIYEGSLYRYATGSPSVFRSLIPGLEQRKSPWVNRYIYNLPFAFQSGLLAPSQPCGEANLDKIVNINLKLQLQPFAGREATAVPRYLIHVWAETYNIFRVYGGRGGMMFAY